MVSSERIELQKGEGAIAVAEEARAYFKAALDYLKPVPPRVIAIGGLSGTGKSTLAAAIAHLVGAAHRIYGACELHKQSIAHRFNDAAPVFIDLWID
jgi:adenylylsulfate kinase-like enzyme